MKTSRGRHHCTRMIWWEFFGKQIQIGPWAWLWLLQEMQESFGSWCYSLYKVTVMRKLRNVSAAGRSPIWPEWRLHGTEKECVYLKQEREKERKKGRLIFYRLVHLPSDTAAGQLRMGETKASSQDHLVLLWGCEWPKHLLLLSHVQ